MQFIYLVVQMVGRCEISVIITAYDRIEYLKDAINSVVKQTLNPSFFEVFVIKTFENTDIDKYTESLGFTNLVFDPSINYGERLIQTIKRCNGDIIVFLEDDDLFAPEKLENIKRVFDNHPQLDYYHNEGTYRNKSLEFDERAKVIESILNLDTIGQYGLIDTSKFSFNDILNSRIWANVSCMALTKRTSIDFAYIFGVVNQPIDVLLFSAAISKNNHIYIEREKNTIIRLHDTNDSFLVSREGDLNSALEKRFLSLQRDSAGIKVMINSFNRKVKIVNVLLSYQDLRLKLLLGLLKPNYNRITLFKSLFLFSMSSLKAAFKMDRFIAFNSLYYIISPQLASDRYISKLSSNFVEKHSAV